MTYSIERIGSLSQEAFDALPFGVIIVDPMGVVLRYNRRESELSGMVPGDVIGKNFFNDVAPCTRAKEFYGAFREGIQKQSLHCSFGFIFTFGKVLRVVTISMYYQRHDERVVIRVDWVGARDTAPGDPDESDTEA